MDLSLLQALEREKVLEVLQRDKILRSMEEERIRKLKSELQEIRRRGAKSFSRQYNERTCARCQRPLGKFWNSGAVCHGCSHRICNKCRVAVAVGVATQDWKCTVCHAYREVKIKSGEWFVEARAKKFPYETDRHNTMGEKLLQSYQRLSNIAIVPPTPPPFCEVPSFNRSGSLKNSRPFTKSVENLMVSFTAQIKKISKSQSDVRGEQVLLTVDQERRNSTGRKSQSDTAINRAPNLTKAPSLPNLFKKTKDEDRRPSTGVLFTDDDLSLGLWYSGEKRGSNSSTGTEYGFFDTSGVTGEIELAIAYNFRTSCLEITINSCKNLSYGDIKRSKCHPYVKMSLLPGKPQSSKMKTTVKKNTTDPVYNETLQCSIERAVLAARTLQVTAWHSGVLKRKVFLGEVRVSLEGWRFEDKATRHAVWYCLGPKPETPEGGAVEQHTGELLVKMKFTSLTQPSWAYRRTDDISIGPHEVGQLTVLVTGVQNLPTSKSSATLNTYVKGCLTLPGSREQVQRTPVVKKKAGPEWAHQLVFSRVTPLDLQTSMLQLGLWDHAPFSLSDRPLGVAKLEGGSLWQPLRQKPVVWHDLSLPLHANVNTKRTR